MAYEKGYFDDGNRRIVFYSLINGVGSSTIAYQLARLLRFPLYQEQKNDLVLFLKAVLGQKYVVKYLDEYNEDEDEYDNAIFDMKRIDAKLFRKATDIIVLTNNSYVDVLRTIATLEKIESVLYDSKKPIHVVFNRLQLGNADREKKYTKASKQLISETLPHLNIIYSYIRTGLVYYRKIEKGKFFMDSFFNEDNEFFKKYKQDLEDVEHTDYLEMMFDYLYQKVEYNFESLSEYDPVLYTLQQEIMLTEREKKVGMTQMQKINQYIAKENFDKKKIQHSKSAIRDMYSLLYKLGGIYDKEYISTDGKTKIRTKIEEN